MIIAFGIVCFVLVVIASMVPRRSILSTYELERRREQGNQSAADELKREVLIGDVMSLKCVAEAVLLVLAVLAATAAFGVLIGPLVSVVIALFYGRIATLD